MKSLKSFDEGRQWRFDHKGRYYSIVDLTVVVGREEIAKLKYGSDMIKRMEETSKMMYGNAKFELADTTEGIEIIGRYETLEKAKEGIKNVAQSL